jgi:hypothetical protein
LKLSHSLELEILVCVFLVVKFVGEVYLGVWEEQNVACKQVKNETFAKEFTQEAVLLAKLHHPNVVRVRYICYIELTLKYFGVYKAKKNYFIVNSSNLLRFPDYGVL